MRGSEKIIGRHATIGGGDDGAHRLPVRNAIAIHISRHSRLANADLCREGTVVDLTFDEIVSELHSKTIPIRQ